MSDNKHTQSSTKDLADEILHLFKYLSSEKKNLLADKCKSQGCGADSSTAISSTAISSTAVSFTLVSSNHRFRVIYLWSNLFRLPIKFF